MGETNTVFELREVCPLDADTEDWTKSMEENFPVSVGK